MSAPGLKLYQSYARGGEGDGESMVMPSMGYGCGTAWFNSQDERKQVLINAVTAALDAGMRHIDEAELYRNEQTTGKALQVIQYPLSLTSINVMGRRLKHYSYYYF